MKSLITTLFIASLFSLKINAQTPTNPLDDPEVAAPTFGTVVKAKNTNSFARVFHGAVHISPLTSSSDPLENHATNIAINYASVPAIQDALLFVEQGVATVDVTHIFEKDWAKWPDYVFDSNYSMISLDDLDTYIKKNKHLPDVITQQEVKKNGVSDKQMSITLLKKIEELTLYTIEQHKSLKAQKELNKSLMKSLEVLEEKVSSLYNNK